jgi:hypothetical protein
MNKSKLCLFSFVVLFSLVGCGESNSSSSSSISSSSSFPTSSSVVSSSSSSSDSTISKYAPVISDDKKTVTYGYYPQTHVSDNATITALDALTSAESNGWYKYNDEYYAKASGNPYTPYDGYVTNFLDGSTQVISDSNYWFKCEPITWKVYASEDGTYSLISNLILKAGDYSTTNNEYTISLVRYWLNDTFYNQAFSLNSSYILPTKISSDVTDNVYILSKDDLFNSNYFADDAARAALVTDYAICKGIAYNSKDTYNAKAGSATYWTSTPDTNHGSNYTYCIADSGRLYDYGVISSTQFGIRPAITIDLN